MALEAHPLSEVAPGVFQWSRFHPEKNLDFNGVFIVAPGGNVVVDPPELDVAQLEEIDARGGVAAVVITNRHHGRRAADVVRHAGARVHVPRKDAAGLDLRVDATFGDADRLPGGLLVIEVPDAKSPGESALLLERDGGTLILGDALIGRPPGQLSLLPPDKFPDPARALRGLQVLLRHDYQRVLVGDGQNPVGGRKAIEEFLARNSSPEV